MASLSISTRYEIHEEIGRGGMGVVYRVTDRLSGEVVALKQVTTGETGTTGINEAADLRLALANEFRTLASLRHPNIIPVVDYGFDEHRQPYFTMYYVDNANTITEAAADMTTQQIGDLLLQTLNALVYLHRRNVIHRDLKPGNILVQGGQVKVMDFGLSLLKSESSKDIFASTVGTLAYMSPELLQGEDYTVSSDLYAVGIVAYELCTGQHPYMGTQIGALVTSILTKQPDLSLVDP
ncbi:MAG: serine/threonine-protein kinase, partial [Chloroflexota bacterium]